MLASALLASIAGQVMAQQQAQDPEEAETEDASAGTLDKITVTGSRIGRDAFNSVSPVQVITREEATLAGFSSTTDLLQSNAVTGGSDQINNAYGGFVTDGGPGANTLSLRGLGATRTLLLLNGRRVSPAGSRGSVGSADLNVLPNAMIDRIEVLKDGASSIYGSDAVAGVVNIITKTRVDGLTLEGRHASTDAGGGDQRAYSLMFGSTGERSHISGSYEFLQRNHMSLGQRGWASDCPTDYQRDLDVGDYWGSADFIDPRTGKPKCWGIDSGGTTINTIGTEALAGVPGPGASGTRFARWRPNSAITSGLVGFEGVGLPDRDTFDPAMLNESLISPVTTHTGFLQGGFDIGALGNAELYYELLANKRRSSQVGYRQLALDYAVGSPLLPEGLRALGSSGIVSDITNGAPTAVRAFIGFGNDRNKQSVEFWRATAGLRGQLGSEWNYDVFVSKARSDASYTFESFLTDRLAQSLEVVPDGAGGFSCRDAGNGCVAAPALSSAVIGGQLPQAWKDWMFVPVTGDTLYQESTFNLGVSGPLFDLANSTVSGAFGVEYREAEIDDTPPLDSINNNLLNLTSATPTRGKDSVWEVFGELELPLLSGVRGAEELTFNVSARYTDYESYGDDTTYKAGLLWTPVRWLSVRSSYGTSYRAPALFEQFLGATSGFLGQGSEPCNEWGERQPDSIRYRNCASLGLPPDFQATQGITVLTRGGAETGLSAETSTAFTAGLILQPEFGSGFGDLSFAVDYYDVQVDNGVSRLSGGAILQRCYDSAPEEFAAGLGLCRLITRDPADASLEVVSSYVNVSSDIVRGLDFTLRYVRDVGPGSLRATAQISRFLEQSSKVFQEDPLVDYNGTLNTPEMTGSLDLSYALRAWRVSYGLEWLDEMSSYERYDEDPATSLYKLDVPNYFVSRASLQYNGDKWSITGGIRNLFDKEPPRISQGAVSLIGNAPLYSGYDYFGRVYFVNVSKTF